MSPVDETRDDPGRRALVKRLVAAARRQAAPREPVAAERSNWGVPAGPIEIPGYEILREIHRGGQGVVYQALQRSTRRKVAIKVMKEGPFAGPSDRLRFEREVQILGALNHPRIVTIHDTGSASGSFYFVMDYVSGEPLDAYMASTSRDIDESLHLFLKICEAVQIAHLRGVIHRDLKPGNIRVDPNSEPHILDFGLAKPVGGDSGAAGEVMTLSGQFVGSLPWASPEQVEGRASGIDLRTDVYSLGVILYQLLTGRFPYEVTGPMREVMERILHNEPARPRSVRGEIDDEVETIVLKCLHKDRDRRYQTAGELGRDIARYLADEPIEAKRDSGWYVLRKVLRRHRFSVGVLAAFVLVLVAFGVAMASARTRAEREADKYRQVLAFLQNMLTGVDPEDIGEETLSVRAVLDQAGIRLDRELVDQPEVAASVHQTLGNHYNKLGLYSDAERHLRAAVALRRQLARGNDPELIGALSDLAAVLHEERKMVEAEAPAREALAMRRQLHGTDSLEVAEGMHDLASILIDEVHGPAPAETPLSVAQMRCAREALELARESLAIRRRLLDEPHNAIAASLGVYGWCHLGLGRLDEAEIALRDAVEMLRRLPGDNERSLAGRLTVLSNVLRSQGNLIGEKEILREAIEIRSRRLAADHPALAWNLLCLARVEFKLGLFEKAESECRRALDIYSKRRESQHENIADCHQTLAQICDVQGRYAEAETWWSACLGLRSRLFSVDHPDLAVAENGLKQSRAAQAGVTNPSRETAP